MAMPNLQLYGAQGLAAGVALFGADRIDDTTTHDADTETERGFWIAVRALSNTTFAAGTEVHGETGVIASGDTLTAGQSLTLPFTAIQISAGVLIAIRG